MKPSWLLGAVPREHLAKKDPRWAWFMGHFGPHWKHVVAYYGGEMYGAVLANDRGFTFATESPGGRVWMSEVVADPETIIAHAPPFWQQALYGRVCPECMRWHCNCLWVGEPPDPMVHTDAEEDTPDENDPADAVKLDQVIEALATESEEPE